MIQIEAKNIYAKIQLSFSFQIKFTKLLKEEAIIQDKATIPKSNLKKNFASYEILFYLENGVRFDGTSSQAICYNLFKLQSSICKINGCWPAEEEKHTQSKGL